MKIQQWRDVNTVICILYLYKFPFQKEKMWIYDIGCFRCCQEDTPLRAKAVIEVIEVIACGDLQYLECQKKVLSEQNRKHSIVNFLEEINNYQDPPTHCTKTLCTGEQRFNKLVPLCKWGCA